MKKKDGLSTLRKAVVGTINGLIQKLVTGNKIQESEINAMCIAGNTVMAYLFLGKDAQPLLDIDAKVDRKSYTETAQKLGLTVNPNADIYILPSVSRFLGGDALGDILSSGMSNENHTSLLIDMGTNGEIILGCKGWIFSSSCASGPAFEGWEIKQGMRGVTGAIDHLQINPQTHQASYTVIGGDPTKATGICGSGMIDAVAEMFSTKILDTQGKIQTDTKSPLIRASSIGPEYIVATSNQVKSGREIVISQRDIDNFLESKSSVCATVSALMNKVRATINDIKNVYLAGAFGNYVNIENCVKIGVFPKFPQAKILQIGNGSIAGAYLTLISKRKRREIDEITRITEYFDMTLDNDFMNEYSFALTLPGKPELFSPG